MNQKNWKTYTFWIILSETVGVISGLLSMGATAAFNETAVQPSLSPPAWVFPVVWSILYALMGISAARIRLSPPSLERSKGTNLFIAQLIINFFWSLIFFNAQAYGFALLWLILLWVLVLWMIISFAHTDKLAALLQIPYLLWLTFAVYLNFSIWQLNM